MQEGRTVELQQTCEIDDVAYGIMLFAPTRALKLQIRLAKIIAAPMAEMAKAAGDVDPLTILPTAVKLLMEKMADEEEVVGLIKDMMTCVTREKKQLNFDLEFHGRLGTMLKLLLKVIEVQFQDFTEALSGSLKGLAKDLSA